jgi:alanyl-tRNA synthetase
VAFPRLAFPEILPKTVKLFHADPYLREAEAEVLHVDREFVVLDRSVFYAESGGQEWDEGEIDGIRVVDVQDQSGRALSAKNPRMPLPSIRVDTVIVHRLAQPCPFKPGQRVHLTLDWARRYANMRNHSASHLVLHGVQEALREDVSEELMIKGCHIHPQGSRFDFAADVPGAKLPDAEAIANELIAKGMPIAMETEPASDEVYYWTYDEGRVVIPCGGTHVRSAAELGPVKLRRSKKGANLTRVSAAFTA